MKYYGSTNEKTHFSRLRLAITINSHILLGANLLLGGGGGPLGPLAGYVPGSYSIFPICLKFLLSKFRQLYIIQYFLFSSKLWKQAEGASFHDFTHEISVRFRWRKAASVKMECGELFTLWRHFHTGRRPNAVAFILSRSTQVKLLVIPRNCWKSHFAIIGILYTRMNSVECIQRKLEYCIFNSMRPAAKYEPALSREQ